VTAALLAYGDAPSSAVSLHVLLTGVQTGGLALLGDAVEVLAVAMYLLGLHRLGRRGRRWPVWSTAAFVAGVLVLWFAVGSGLAAYDEVNVTLHVVQHILLMMVAPPLIALGKPVTLAAQAASRPNQVRVLKVVHSPVVAAATFPAVAWLLYYGGMYGYFLTPVYPYSVAHPLFHHATHLLFFLIGYLYWHPVVGLDPAKWRWPFPVRIGSLFLGMPFEAFLGISIADLRQPISPINTLAGTHVAGETFWVASMGATGFCLAAVVYQWYRQLEREAPREDRRAELAGAQSRARAEELGLHDVPDGFTVPWWRLAELERARLAAAPPADEDLAGEEDL
jgi:cytochrome c oxidase assembly factor CtaG